MNDMMMNSPTGSPPFQPASNTKVIIIISPLSLIYRPQCCSLGGGRVQVDISSLIGYFGLFIGRYDIPVGTCKDEDLDGGSMGCAATIEEFFNGSTAADGGMVRYFIFI